MGQFHQMKIERFLVFGNKVMCLLVEPSTWPLVCETQSIVLAECKTQSVLIWQYSSKKVKGKVFPIIISLFSHLTITYWVP